MNLRTLAAAVTVIAITGIAICLRVRAQQGIGITSDEAFSWAVIRDSVDELADGSHTGEFRTGLRRVANDSHPPLSFLIQAAWMLLFGDSLVALRSLSMLCSLLIALCAYMAVREALHWGCGEVRSCAMAPAFAAVLAAIHLGQVSAGSTARMYALGGLLSAATAWWLLRALREEESGWGRRWTLYGFGIAAFAYTHNFALLSIAAQGLFVAFVLAIELWRRRRTAARHLLGFSAASLLAAALYSPWLPVALEQVQRMEAGFWIKPVTRHELQRSVIAWMVGDWIGGAHDVFIWFAALGLAAFWRFAHRDTGAIFFLFQFIVPWTVVVMLSALGPQSILQDRYMAFSQVALCCFWGVLLARVKLWPTRLGLAAFVVAPSALVTAAHLNQISKECPAIERTTQRLLEEYLPGDVVVFSDAATLNRVRYYAQQCGRELQLRVPYPEQLSGQESHISSLRARDVRWSGSVPPPGVQRIWTVQGGIMKVDASWKRVHQEFLEDRAGLHRDRFDLSLYVKVQ